MAKKIEKIVKLQIPADKATLIPPVGPAPGQAGINIMGFIKEFSVRAADQVGLIIPIVISVYEDRSLTFATKIPPAVVLLRKVAKIEKGSDEPNRNGAARASSGQVREIAELKMEDLDVAGVEAAMRMVEGTARSTGITVE